MLGQNNTQGLKQVDIYIPKFHYSQNTTLISIPQRLVIFLRSIPNKLAPVYRRNLLEKKRDVRLYLDILSIR